MKPDDLRAKAKRLYHQTQTMEDAVQRLAHVFRALELEMDADALEQEQGAIPKPQAIDRQTGGGDRENG